MHLIEKPKAEIPKIALEDNDACAVLYRDAVLAICATRPLAEAVVEAVANLGRPTTASPLRIVRAASAVTKEADMTVVATIIKTALMPPEIR